jgi:hypothetical protein
VISAADSVSITTGSASITMKKDGTITIKGKDITIDGSGKINVKASSDIVMTGKKIGTTEYLRRGEHTMSRSDPFEYSAAIGRAGIRRGRPSSVLARKAAVKATTAALKQASSVGTLVAIESDGGILLCSTPARRAIVLRAGPASVVDLHAAPHRQRGRADVRGWRLRSADRDGRPARSFRLAAR